MMDKIWMCCSRLSKALELGDFLNDPFVLASQVQQNFYIQDPIEKNWHAVIKPSGPRDLYDMSGSNEERAWQIDNEPNVSSLVPIINVSDDSVHYLRGDMVFTRSHPSLAGLMKMGQSIWNTTENIDASLEDSEFELPMLNQSELENSNAVDGANSTGNWKALTPNSNSSVSAADVLKTLFFILVRYTFSTFLTLYNKTLLGDDLGKFPAALLMNTVHFRMQAVLSKAITWYWSHRYQPTVAMSWRDCLYR
ncbi:hypothetical protein POUND7_007520, partial [Theobroma cacao]